MRLFKFLVISNQVMESSNIIKHKVRERLDNKEVISTKNEFFTFCYDLHSIVGDKTEMVLMSIDYPNENTDFRRNNKAYIVIDANNIEEVMKLVAPAKISKGKHFQVCYIKDRSECNFCSWKICKNKNTIIHFKAKIKGEEYVRGKTWDFANDTAGTKGYIVDNLCGSPVVRRIEPKTGGIAYSSLQWEKHRRPINFKWKTVSVPLHHWIYK